MRYIADTVDFELKEPTVVTLGKFDGRHRGHQKLLRTMEEVKESLGYATAIFTFSTAPLTLVTGEIATVITTSEERRHNMEKMGIDVKEYRPPWGHLNLMSLYCIRKMHLQLIFWDVMAQDWSAKETADSICNKILRRVFPGAVICLHDGRGENGAPGRTIEALKKAIPMLKAQGYEFRRIEEKYETAGRSEIS